MKSKQIVDFVVANELATRQQIKLIVDGMPEVGRSTNKLAKELVARGLLTNFQIKEMAAGRAGRLSLGEYTILEKIGQGGMGDVFLALHRRMGRQVAVKFISGGSQSSEAIKRFQREVKAAAQLTHQNIVAAYDAGEFEGNHYLVMEYVHGEDLSHRVQRSQRSDLAEVIDWIVQAAEGLDYAHRNDIIHRDIKPSNLLLSEAGQIKILDMGLARGMGSSELASSLTGTGVVMGTLEFISPEQAMDPAKVDPRADIYSLGCTLYRLATKKAAYSGDSAVKIILAHRSAPLPDLLARRPDATPQLQMVMHRMIAKRKEDRFGDARELIDALNGVKLKMPSSTEQVTLPHIPTGALAGPDGDAATEQFEELPVLGDAETAAHLMDAEESTALHVQEGFSSFDAGKPAAGSSRRLVTPKRKPNLLPWFIGLGTSFSGFAAIGVGLLAWNMYQDSLANKGNESLEIATTPEIETEAPTATKLPPLPDPFSDRAAAEWALSIGGKVRVVDPNRDSYEVYQLANLPSGIFRVESLDLRNLSSVNDTSIAKIRRLSAMRDLILRGTNLTDLGLTYLEQLSTLRSLDIRDCSITAQGLKKVAERQQLTTLLAEGVFDDDAIALLESLPNLSSLQLQTPAATDDGLASLCRYHPAMSTLMLEEWQLQDSEVRVLSSLPQIQSLGLINMPLTDGAVEHLEKLTSLRTLIVQGTKISSDGVRRLQASLPDCKIFGGTYSPRRNAVRDIVMMGGRVKYSASDTRNKWLGSFAELPDDFLINEIDLSDVPRVSLENVGLEEVERLTLTDSGVGNRDLQLISRKFPLLVELITDGTLVTNSELATFGALERLQFVDATRSSATEEGADSLRKQLPECEVLIGKSQFEIDREIVSFVHSIGGRTGLVIGGEYKEINKPAEMPEGRFRLTAIRADWRDEMNDKAVGIISRARYLELLWSQKNSFSDAGINLLSRMRNLKMLMLHYPKHPELLSDVGLASLGKLPKLETLSVAGWPITERGIQAFGKSDVLHKFECATQTASEAGSLLNSAITLFPNLRIGSFNSRFTDADLMRLPKLQNLESFEGDFRFVSPVAATALGSCPKLQKLNLQRASREFLEAVLGELQNLPDFRHLMLNNSGADDRLVGALANLRQLETLEIQRTKITRKGEMRLSELLPDTKITRDLREAWALRCLELGAELKISLPRQRELREIRLPDELPEQYQVIEVSFLDTAVDPSFWHLEDRRVGEDNNDTIKISLRDCFRFTGAELFTGDQLKKLQELDLSGTSMSDVHLQKLALLPSVRYIDLSRTSCSEKSIRLVSQQMPRCVFVLDDVRIQAGRSRSVED